MHFIHPHLYNRNFTKGFIYFFSFLFTLHLTPSYHINSNYLSQILGNGWISVIYALGSLISLLGLLFIRKNIDRFGNYKIFLGLMFLSVLSLACIIFFDFKVISILGFIIMLSLPTLIFLSIDIFLEKISKDKNTGEIRGKYLAFLNSAFIIGPIISSVILLYSDMKAVYLFSLVLLIIVLIIGAISFRKFQDPEYTKVDIKKGIIKVWNNNNLRNLFGAGLSLNIFYAVMVIYVPVYLISKMDFSLSQVALMIAIALVPFVILQSYLGKMADKVFGEKEIMIAGFAIMGLILILAGIWQSPVWLIWTIILFVSRIGASMVEVMTETYLFKKINAEEIDIISIYRIMYPIGYLIVPFLGFFITGILDYRFLFILTAIFLLTYGIKFAVRIRDTL